MSLLITGATGSMGRYLTKQYLREGTAVTVFSRDEAKQYEMQMSGEFAGARFMIGDIRDERDVARALVGNTHVIHAAALKQVPTCEVNVKSAIETNCGGTLNLVDQIVRHAHWVEKVVAISTDKACKPTTVMGMTKALQERIILEAGLRSRTRFACVRYGNVLGSRGSIVPLFRNQLAAGKPITITDSSMTRFLMTIEQAAELVMKAVWKESAGQIFVPRAPSARVVDIAAALAAECGVVLEFKIVGVRPGEKIHEIMISVEEQAVQRGMFYSIASPVYGRQADGIRFPGEYSSGTDVLPARAVADFLRKHGVTK